MNFKEAEDEIRAHFSAAMLAGGFTASYIAWPDVEFTIPEGQTWVRFNCQENDGSQVSMGSPGANRFRQFGIVTIQIFQPLGQGSNDARTKAVIALGAFRGEVTTNNIHFFDVAGRQVGNDGNGYYQINVVASFYYDEIT